MRWTKSSILLYDIRNIQEGQSSTSHGIGFNQKSTRLTNPDENCLYNHYRRTCQKNYSCPKSLKAHGNRLKFLKNTYDEKIKKLVSKTIKLPNWHKSDLFILSKTTKHGPKWIWLPKTNPWYFQETVREEMNAWYLDSVCSIHMSRYKNNFLSKINHKGGNVAFGNIKRD